MLTSQKDRNVHKLNTVMFVFLSIKDKRAASYLHTWGKMYVILLEIRKRLIMWNILKQDMEAKTFSYK